MNKNEKENNNIFPAAPDKTYGLMALVKGTTSMVEKEPEDTEFTYPKLIIKEMICFMILTTVLVIIALIFKAPLEELANPAKTPNPAKAPWYFLGLQELLHYFSPFVAGVLIPGLAGAGLISLPYLDRNRDGIGVWFSSKRKLVLTIFTVFVITLVVLTIIGLFFRGPGWGWVWPWEHVVSVD